MDREAWERGRRETEKDLEQQKEAMRSRRDTPHQDEDHDGDDLYSEESYYEWWLRTAPHDNDPSPQVSSTLLGSSPEVQYQATTSGGKSTQQVPSNGSTSTDTTRTPEKGPSSPELQSQASLSSGTSTQEIPSNGVNSTGAMKTPEESPP